MRRALTQFEATAFESDTSVISMMSSSMCVIVSLCVQKYKYVAASQGFGSKSCQYQNFVTEQQKYLSVKWREDERVREKNVIVFTKDSGNKQCVGRVSFGNINGDAVS